MRQNALPLQDYNVQERSAADLVLQCRLAQAAPISLPRGSRGTNCRRLWEDNLLQLSICRRGSQPARAGAALRQAGGGEGRQGRPSPRLDLLEPSPVLLTTLAVDLWKFRIRFGPLLDVRDIPQVGPLRRGRDRSAARPAAPSPPKADLPTWPARPVHDCRGFARYRRVDDFIHLSRN